MFIHLNTRSCLEIRIHDGVIVQKMIAFHLKRFADFKYLGTNLTNRTSIHE
jgi:hypothetical protein